MAKASTELEKLETFFTDRQLPASIQLEPSTMIPDVALFVRNNLDALRKMDENAAEGRFYRLNKLMALLDKQP